MAKGVATAAEAAVTMRAANVEPGCVSPAPPTPHPPAHRSAAESWTSQSNLQALVSSSVCHNVPATE